MNNDLNVNYELAPITAINLRIAMERYFPKSPRSSIELYEEVSNKILPFLSKYNYPPITMDDIDNYISNAIVYIDDAAKIASYEPNRHKEKIAHAWLLNVILQSFYKEWYKNYANDFRDTAIRLRSLIENSSV